MGFGRGKGFTSAYMKLGTKLIIKVGGVSVSKTTSDKLTTSVTVSVS